MMKMVSINGRNCEVYAPAAPKGALVLLHSKDTIPIEMAACVDVQSFVDADIAVIIPSSSDPLKWNRQPGSDDFGYVATLGPFIFGMFPSLTGEIHLAGLSSGGFMAAVVAVYAPQAYEQYWQVCATWPKDVPEPIAGWGASITLVYADQDRIVPPTGNAECMSVDQTRQLYQLLDMPVITVKATGGHGWPGGNGPKWDKAWPESPDVTVLMINTLSSTF